MAGRIELETHLTADDDASKVIEKVADAAADLEDKPVEIEIDSNITKALNELDRLSQEAASTAIAAEELGRALGPELTARADMTRVVQELGRLGVSADEVTANVSEMAAKLRAVDSPDLGGNLGAALGTARGQIDDLNRSASSSKSVLANMVGNATQDLGALGGIAGSAGVAIGQMGEYMADAAGEGDKFGAIVRNFGTVAGPIAAIALATQLVSEAMASARKSSEAHADSVGDWTDAMREGGDAAEAFADQMREAEEVTAATGKATLDSIGPIGSFVDKTAGLAKLLGEGAERLGLFGNEIEDITPLLAKAGLTIERFAELATATDATAAQEQLARALSSTSLSGDEQGKVLTALTDQQNAHAEATDNAKDIEAVFGTEIADNTALIEENNRKVEEAAQRRRDFADALKLAQAGLAAAIDDADAFAAALDRVNEASELDFSRMALDTVESFDSMKAALDGLKDTAVDWSSVDLTPDSIDELRGIPDELAAVTEGISGMRDTIQAELTAAFETGGIDAYTAKAEFFRTQVLDQFPGAFEAAGASAEDAAAQSAALADELGLMPHDIEIMIQLTREEEARAALDAFSNVISQMPQNVQVAINAAIAEGDIAGALTILNEQLINRGYEPIVLPVDADTAPADDAVQGIAGQTLDAATIPLEADTEPAEEGISDVERGSYETTIMADADTQRAAAELLETTQRDRTSFIYAVALVANAARNLDALTAARSTPVDAYLREYPSAGEIARAIGTVRVPVVAETQRLAGARP